VVTARTLAQQLEIPVFAISTLAAVAWAEPPQPRAGTGAPPWGGHGGTAPTTGGLLRDDIALQMRAQRGQLFGAIYSVNKDLGLTELFTDTVMTPESWGEKLEKWGNSYQLIEVASELGSSVSSVLELAYLEWQRGNRPNWSEALPYYGQHPVQEKK
jgi:tRNA A37 threonylcarbamoyladenosine modification protein TsaB